MHEWDAEAATRIKHRCPCLDRGAVAPVNGNRMRIGHTRVAEQMYMRVCLTLQYPKVVITEDTVIGTFIAGNRVGWSSVNSGLPRAVGVLGKDLRVITLRNEGVSVESTLQSPGPGQTGTPLAGFRICVRDRVLRKL